MLPSRNTDPDYVLNRIKDLLRYAEETEKDTSSILGLRMNQLGLHEAAESRRQGRILMAFTIVTIIFLPLSFLSSLFALNVATFPHLGDDLFYQPGWIFGILCNWDYCRICDSSSHRCDKPRGNSQLDYKRLGKIH
ncbi:hypothetical protein F4776DRAFT_42940 [Hypoxylon sp. NC0597]|nr:hypothetical protein F4776DRAFT_42940 [Hypoxylon sp. NC0597]